MLVAALELDPTERDALIATATGACPVPVTSALGTRGAQPAFALPAPPGALIGREQESRDVTQFLLRDDVRLLALTGPGGVGKTHLSLSVAAAQRHALADGVAFVDRSPLDDPELVAAAVAQVLGMRQAGAEDIWTNVLACLRPKQQLLLLDNFAQLLDAVFRLTDIRATGPRAMRMVTSRTALRMRGEQLYRCPSLAPPPAHSSVDNIASNAAARIFVTRAQAVEPDFRLCVVNVVAVAEICRGLEGLPLARVSRSPGHFAMLRLPKAPKGSLRQRGRVGNQRARRAG